MPASHCFKNALILGLLSAIGPFAIDIYLPALPDIGRSLGSNVDAVQITLRPVVGMTSGAVRFGVDLADPESPGACGQSTQPRGLNRSACWQLW